MAWLRRTSSTTSRKDSFSAPTTPREVLPMSGGMLSPSSPAPPTPMSPGIMLPTFLGPRDLSLPAPAVQSAAGSSTRRRAKKSARIDDGRGGQGGKGVRVHWARFKKRIGTGTAPSSSSEVGAESAYTGGSSILGRHYGREQDMTEEEKAGPVDEVVVDRSWFDEMKSSVVSHSEQDPNKDTPATSIPNGGTNTTDHDSLALRPEGFWAWNFLFVMLRYRLWPATLDFFSLRFMDAASENHYRKETWFLQKSLAIWSSLFLILNWVLTAGTLPSPVILPDRIFFYGISTVLTFGVLPMVMWDWPRDRPVLYQIWLTTSIWSWTIFNFFSMYFCGFYTRTKDHKPYPILITCGNKDFLATFFFVTALPTIGLFGLKLKRFPQLVGTLVFFVVGCVLILQWKVTWYRNLIAPLIFHLFLLFVHYARENSERRLYVLRDMLKMQYKATQKAQINERKAAESKRRLTSYVQVRVPLNTALLAVQNMAALGVFTKSHDLEYNALEGSLAMMSKVLNDVLDFNRMDSGKFESVSKPYAFHQVLRSLCVPLRMATDARKLELCIDLDDRIDLMARRAAYLAMGESEENIKRRLEDYPDDPGMVVGDEMRLRQIVNNLASNACKFTPAGGKVTITSRLVWPTQIPVEYRTPTETPSETAVADGATGLLRTQANSRHSGETAALTAVASEKRPTTVSSQRSEEGNGPRSPVIPQNVLSINALDAHNARLQRPAMLEKVIVRIEVTDTGCGIQSHDMAKNKLFSAFNQTEQGRQQGGKGTGLGLALVRQIVKRSGGRLGVYSAGTNQGSKFWVELPLAIGAKAIVGGFDRLQRLQSTDMTAARHEIDTALADLTPPRTGEEPRPRMFSPPVPLPRAQLGSIMDQRGRMVSLPTAPGEESNPMIARMAISDPLPSPDSDRQSFTEGVAESVPASPVVQEPSPPQSYGRSEKPPSIQLPTTSPAALMAMRHAQGSPPPHSPPPSLHASSTSPSIPLKPGPSSNTPWNAMPVLVVDDDSLTRMLMKRLLTRLGCRVTTAENGEAALELLTGSPRPTPSSEDAPTTPDTRAVSEEGTLGTSSTASMHTWWTEESKYAVCFLDNQMPVCSGLEAVSRLRHAGRKDFVVGVTGNALLTDQEEYLEAGADYVLTKPVLEKSLRGMLTIADEKRKARLKVVEGHSSGAK